MIMSVDDYRFLYGKLESSKIPDDIHEKIMEGEDLCAEEETRIKAIIEREKAKIQHYQTPKKSSNKRRKNMEGIVKVTPKKLSSTAEEFFILLCTVGALMMGIVGCKMTGLYEKKAERRLEDRYGIPFEVERVISRNIFDGYYEVLAYPEDDPDMLVRASVDFEGEGESDDYAIKLLCRKISDRVARKMDNLNGTYFINTVPTLPVYGFFDTNMTIEQYMEKFPMDSFRICVNYNPDALDEDALYRVLSDAVAGLDCFEHNSYICLHLVSGYDLIEIQQYLKEHDKEYADYVWNEPYYLVGNFDFECGKFVMTESDIKSTIVEFREKYMK